MEFYFSSQGWQSHIFLCASSQDLCELVTEDNGWQSVPPDVWTHKLNFGGHRSFMGPLISKTYSGAVDKSVRKTSKQKNWHIFSVTQNKRGNGYFSFRNLSLSIFQDHYISNLKICISADTYTHCQDHCYPLCWSALPVYCAESVLGHFPHWRKNHTRIAEKFS